MQGQHFAIYHHIHGRVQIECHPLHRFSFSQRMLNVRAIVKLWQVSDQPPPADGAPANIFNQPAINFQPAERSSSFRR